MSTSLLLVLPLAGCVHCNSASAIKDRWDVESQRLLLPCKNPRPRVGENATRGNCRRPAVHCGSVIVSEDARNATTATLTFTPEQSDNTASAFLYVGRASKPENLGDNSMFTIRPVGPAACVCALAAIRVPQGCRGAIHTRGFLEPLSKRVAGPTGFLYARIDCPGRLRPWEPLYIPARERSPYDVEL
jgi:hypothetical protein